MSPTDNFTTIPFKYQKTQQRYSPVT